MYDGLLVPHPQIRAGCSRSCYPDVHADIVLTSSLRITITYHVPISIAAMYPRVEQCVDWRRHAAHRLIRGLCVPGRTRCLRLETGLVLHPTAVVATPPLSCACPTQESEIAFVCRNSPTSGDPTERGRIHNQRSAHRSPQEHTTAYVERYGAAQLSTV